MRREVMGTYTHNRQSSVAAFQVGLAFIVSFLLCAAQGDVHYYNLVLKQTNMTKLCASKSLLTANDSFPGPPLYAHKGDTISVTIHNQGPYGVTIHWHGVRNMNNPWSDGPEYITQCPIPANSTFTQEIILSTEEGTLWWHAHSDWTRATVHGPLIIYPINGTSYPFEKPDAEQTLVIGEWYKGDVMLNIETALATGGDPNLSDAYTFNGEPGDVYPCSSASMFHILVDYGKTYLLRLINAAMNEEMFFGIAGHNLTLVGMDGAYLKPLDTSYVMITPGQSMDILVHANQNPSYYYIEASPFVDTNAPSDTNITRAVLQYNGNYTVPSNISSPTLPGETDKDSAGNFTVLLRSLNSPEHPANVPKNITKRFFIAVSVNQQPCPANQTCLGPQGEIHSASLNNISFVAPNISILQAYHDHLTGVYNTTFPREPNPIFDFTGNLTALGEAAIYGTEVMEIEYGDEVEIIFQGTNFGAAENHPMHLHGYSFYVVGMDYGNFSNTSSPATYNTVDPPELNTVGLPKNGWTTIRFKADNPGVWFMHCHLERHASWGMDGVLIVKDGQSQDQKVRPQPSYMPPCQAS